MADWEKLYPHPAFRRVAYPAVTLPDGTRLKREIVVFAADGTPKAHFPLTEEVAFTEWRGTEYAWGAKPV